MIQTHRHLGLKREIKVLTCHPLAKEMWKLLLRRKGITEGGQIPILLLPGKAEGTEVILRDEERKIIMKTPIYLLREKVIGFEMIRRQLSHGMNGGINHHEEEKVGNAVVTNQEGTGQIRTCHRQDEAVRTIQMFHLREGTIKMTQVLYEKGEMVVQANQEGTDQIRTHHHPEEIVRTIQKCHLEDDSVDVNRILRLLEDRNTEHMFPLLEGNKRRTQMCHLREEHAKIIPTQMHLHLVEKKEVQNHRNHQKK